MQSISTVQTALSGISGIEQQQSPAANNFAQTLKNALSETNKALQDADQAIQKVNTGQNESLHNVMISMEKADLSLRLLVQMRNKAVESYREIMRMQV